MSPKIEIFTANFCPYCKDIKDVLTSKELKYDETVVDTPALRKQLIQRTDGRKTLPQVFINNVHIGGYEIFKELERNGELDALKKNALSA